MVAVQSAGLKHQLRYNTERRSSKKTRHPGESRYELPRLVTHSLSARGAVTRRSKSDKKTYRSQSNQCPKRQTCTLILCPVQFRSSSPLSFPLRGLARARTPLQSAPLEPAVSYACNSGLWVLSRKKNAGVSMISSGDSRAVSPTCLEIASGHAIRQSLWRGQGR